MAWQGNNFILEEFSMLSSEKSRENKLRYALKGQWYLLRKSRVRQIHGNNLGGYMIVVA